MDEQPNAWKLQAACRGEDVNLFFVLKGKHRRIDRRQAERAKSFCSNCSVRNECFEEAMSTQDFEAVRAGLSPDELRSAFNRRAYRSVGAP